MKDENSDLFSLVEISKKVNLAHSTVWDHFKRGKLPNPQEQKGRIPLWDANGFIECLRYFRSRKSHDRLER